MATKLGKGSFAMSFGGVEEIAICGMSGTQRQAELKRPGELWGVPWDPFSHRYDILFEMHDRSVWERRGEAYIEELRESPQPIFMQQEHDDIPNSVAFPLEDAIRHLNRDYFSSSVAYMLAFAALVMPHRVSLWGVDNHADEQWAEERPNHEYLLGVLQGKGIEVWVHPRSSLLRFKPENWYGTGYATQAPIKWNLRYGYLADTENDESAEGGERPGGSGVSSRAADIFNLYS